MGTLFHFDEVLPAVDGKADAARADTRQVEIFRPSGEDYIALRIGELNEENMGCGPTVRLNKKEAVALLEGVERALGYFGWLPD